jgi:hypothetical protein
MVVADRGLFCVLGRCQDPFVVLLLQSKAQRMCAAERVSQMSTTKRVVNHENISRLLMSIVRCVMDGPSAVIGSPAE